MNTVLPLLLSLRVKTSRPRLELLAGQIQVGFGVSGHVSDDHARETGLRFAPQLLAVRVEFADGGAVAGIDCVRLADGDVFGYTCFGPV